MFSERSPLQEVNTTACLTRNIAVGPKAGIVVICVASALCMREWVAGGKNFSRSYRLS